MADTAKDIAEQLSEFFLSVELQSGASGGQRSVHSGPTLQGTSPPETRLDIYERCIVHLDVADRKALAEIIEAMSTKLA